MKEKILVTGATGFVGSNLVRRLLKENYEVHILTRENSNLWRIKEVYSELIDWKVDLNNEEKLKKIIEKINPSYIIHLAIYGGYSFQNNEKEIFNVNLFGTINLIKAAENINYKCFINTGSSSEYGEKKEKMIENMLCEPNTSYGIAKLAATLYCQNEAKLKNKPIGTLRLFSPYGPFEEKGRLFESICSSIVKKEEILLNNPRVVRDFLYIEDVIEAYIAVLKEPNKLKGNIFNICSGNQKSIEEVIDTIKLGINKEISVKYNNNLGRSFDTVYWEGSNEKFKEVYNWEIKNSLKAGIEKTLKWYELENEMEKDEK